MLLTNGMSFMLNTTTPWCSGVSSVIRPRCALRTWFPYKKGISPFGFIHTCRQYQCRSGREERQGWNTLYFAYWAR